MSRILPCGFFLNEAYPACRLLPQVPKWMLKRRCRGNQCTNGAAGGEELIGVMYID